MEIKYMKIDGEIKEVQVYREKRLVEFIYAKTIDGNEFYWDVKEEELLYQK